MLEFISKVKITKEARGCKTINRAMVHIELKGYGSMFCHLNVTRLNSLQVQEVQGAATMDGEEDEILEKGKRKKETKQNSKRSISHHFNCHFPSNHQPCWRLVVIILDGHRGLQTILLETLTFVFSTALKCIAAHCSNSAASHTTPA